MGSIAVFMERVIHSQRDSSFLQNYSVSIIDTHPSVDRISTLNKPPPDLANDLNMEHTGHSAMRDGKIHRKLSWGSCRFSIQPISLGDSASTPGDDQRDGDFSVLSCSAQASFKTAQMGVS